MGSRGQDVLSVLARLSNIAWNGRSPAWLAAWEQSNAVAGSTARQRRLWALERLYLGRQYEGRVPWEGPASGNTPARERAPSVQGGLGEEIVNRYMALFGGVTRRPVLHVADQPEATQFLGRLLGAAGFGGALHDALRQGLCPGTGVLVGTWRFGWPRARIYGPAYCTPVWAETARSPEDIAAVEKYSVAPDDLVRLSVLFVDEQEDEHGRVVDVWRREDHTPTEVVRYEPLRVAYGNEENKSDPRLPRADEWRRDEARSAKHGYGFVLAEWLRPLGEYGGEADGPCLLGEPDGPLARIIEEYDLTMSLAGRAAHRNATPTPFFSGMSLDLLKKFDPAKPFATPAADGKFYYMESTGTGVDRAHAHAKELKDRAREMALVVVHDPDSGGEPSGEALRLKFAPMLARIEEWRGEVGPQIARMGRKLLHAALAELSRGEARIAKALVGADARALRALRSADIEVTVSWPPVFPLTSVDRQRGIQTAALARSAELVSVADAVRFVASHAMEDIDVTSTLEALEQERSAAAQAYIRRDEGADSTEGAQE
jgi:hypothetical protein